MMHHGKILGHAKNWIVITFGLKDIAVSALFGILHFTAWSPKQKSCVTPKYWGMQKEFGVILFGLGDIAISALFGIFTTSTVYQCCTSVDLTTMSRRRRLSTTV